MDERLLAPCTRALLEGWTGPVHGYLTLAPPTGGSGYAHNGIPARAVSIGEFDPLYGRAMLWTQAFPGLASVEDLSLDLSIAECRDRVARVLATLLGGRPTDTSVAPCWACGMSAQRREARRGAREDGWTLYTGAQEWWFGSIPGKPTSALDSNDDTRLSDGSRLVDALALASVWRHLRLMGVPHVG